jgi:hypothetical protein
VVTPAYFLPISRDPSIPFGKSPSILMKERLQRIPNCRSSSRNASEKIGRHRRHPDYSSRLLTSLSAVDIDIKNHIFRFGSIRSDKERKSVKRKCFDRDLFAGRFALTGFYTKVHIPQDALEKLLGDLRAGYKKPSDSSSSLSGPASC